MDSLESCQRTDEDQSDEGNDEHRDCLLRGGGNLGQGQRQEEQEDEESDETIHEAEESKRPRLHPGVTF